MSARGVARGVVNEFTTDLRRTCFKHVSLLAIGFIRWQEQTDILTYHLTATD